MIPAGRLSPQALALLNLLPHAERAGTENGTRNNYIAQGSEKLQRRPVQRPPRRPAQRQAEHLRPVQLRQVRPRRAGRRSARAAGRELVSLGGNSKVKNHSLALGFDYTLNTTTILDLRFGWFQYNVDVLPFDYGTTPRDRRRDPGPELRRHLHLRACRRSSGATTGGPSDFDFGLGPRGRPLQLPARPGREAVADRLEPHEGARATTPSSSASTSGAPTTCACRATPTGRASSTSTPNRTHRPERRRARPRHLPAGRRHRPSSRFVSTSTDARENAVAPVLLRPGHLAGDPEADPQLRPAGRHHQPADGQRGGQRRLARHHHRRDAGRRGGRHRPGRQRQEQDQLGAARRRHVPAQREDRDARRLRAQLRHRRLRLDLRPRGDAEPAGALHPGAERSRTTSTRVFNLADGPARPDLRRARSRTAASRCRTACPRACCPTSSTCPPSTPGT